MQKKKIINNKNIVFKRNINGYFIDLLTGFYMKGEN